MLRQVSKIRQPSLCEIDWFVRRLQKTTMSLKITNKRPFYTLKTRTSLGRRRISRALLNKTEWHANGWEPLLDVSCLFSDVFRRFRLVRMHLERITLIVWALQRESRHSRPCVGYRLRIDLSICVTFIKQLNHKWCLLIGNEHNQICSRGLA